MHGDETRSLALNDGHKLHISDSKLFSKIFWSKNQEVNEQFFTYRGRLLVLDL
jgi:hypothetical protein